MRRSGRFFAESLFVIVAVVLVFFFTVHQMSMDGVLPGNDPAVHLGKAKNIVINERVNYSEIPWYPPLFHTFLAVLLLFGGTFDVIVTSLLLKFVVATINVLILLSTYLLCKRLLGVSAAVAAAVFTILSVPLFETIFWGGYTSFLGIAYIPLIFYITNTESKGSVKAFLLFLVTFALFLTHQLAAFVFLLVFFPAFLIGTRRSRRRLLTFLTVVVAGSLAVLAWYVGVIMRYSSVFFYHIFFGMREYAYSIPSVTLESFIKIFGTTLFLALAGIPLTLLLLKRRKALKNFPLLFLWIAVPFLLSQSYIFGFYLPFERFIYFMATPIAIFAGVTACNLAKLPSFMASRFSSTIKRKTKTLDVARVFTLAVLVVLFFSQFFPFLQRLQDFPRYYEVSGNAGLNVGEWLRQYSNSNGSVVVSEKPGAWLGLISDLETIEETNVLYGRNAVAEAVLYHFYEMDNTRSLSREYTLAGSIQGQVMYVSVYNIWQKVLSIPDNEVHVIYLDTYGEEQVVSMSEVEKKTFWTRKSVDESQMVSEYSNDLFTLLKMVTFNSQDSLINLKWRLTTKQDLAGVKLRVFNLMEPSLNFKEAFVPGVLEWQNPWDKASSVNTRDNWAVIECPPNTFDDNLTAVLDRDNGVLAIFEFAHTPDWLNIGALGNRFIDALRVGYEFDHLMKGESREISFSVLTYFSEPKPFEPPTSTFMRQLLDSRSALTVQTRDFLTYIEEYDIKFVVIDTQKLPDAELPSILSLIYCNGKFAVYVVRR